MGVLACVHWGLCRIGWAQVTAGVQGKQYNQQHCDDHCLELNSR